MAFSFRMSARLPLCRSLFRIPNRLPPRAIHEKPGEHQSTPRLWRYGATVSTWPFQGQNAGSIPASATKAIEKLVQLDTWIQRKDRPVNVAKRNAKNKKYPVYTADEFAAMLAVAEKAEYALLYLFVGSGWRNGEGAVAQWADIDWDAKTITVREKPEFQFTPKDYECRTVELADNVLDALQSYRDDTPEDALLFPAPEGGVNRHLEDRVVLPIIERANAQGFKVKRPKKPLHALRVLYACRLSQAGVDLETVRVNLGHSDISTTQIYLRAVEAKSVSHRHRINDAMTFRPATKLRVAS
jgi:integrase